MLILQEGAGVYSPDCRDLSVKLKEGKDAPCSAVSRDLQRPAEMKEGSPISRSYLPARFDSYNLSDHLCIAQFSLSDTIICFALIFFLFH